MLPESFGSDLTDLSEMWRATTMGDYPVREDVGSRREEALSPRQPLARPV